MKVIATKIGYYDHKRRYPVNHAHPEAGQPFTLKDVTLKGGKVITAEKQFSGSWMERYEDEVPSKRKSYRAQGDREESSVKPTGNQEVI